MTLWAAGLVAFTMAFGMGPVVIPLLTRLKLGQMVRQTGPQSHLKKQGTPLMGGILFLLPLPVVVAIFDRQSLEAWALVFIIWGFGLVGFADDFLKVVLKRPLGLRAREKLLLQIILAVGFTWVVGQVLHLGQNYVLPFGLGTISVKWWFVPLSVLAILGSGNAVNITDGLDGLAAGATGIAMMFFTFWGVVFHHNTVSLVGIAMAAGLLGFLRYNIHPARVFMGDTGSLALGAALAGLAIVSQTTLLLPLIGILFVVETLSVIIQVIGFKLTGKRVFRMSPIHHHFELGGWPEERVVSVFWVFSILGALLAWW
jgi:phospho-N-acetylmuramoyl-pentapeptide-transferase